MTKLDLLTATLLICAAPLICSGDLQAAADERERPWQDSFALDKCTHQTKGKNRFFILEPGYQIVLAGKNAQVVMTVLDETEEVNGMVTRVVEEKEFEGGKLIEVSRNFFTICKEHHDVFYHGEDVDDYKDGKVVGHGGAWRAGVDGAKAGLMMPGKTEVGLRHYQEIAPKVAMDRAEIVEDQEVLEAPRRKYVGCLRVVETSPLEPGTQSIKLYAPGGGMVFDDGMVVIDQGYDRKSPDAPIAVNVNVSGAYAEVDISEDEMPAPVAAFLRKSYPQGRIQEVKRETRLDGQIVFAIEVIVDGAHVDVEATAEGKVLRNAKE